MPSPMTVSIRIDADGTAAIAGINGVRQQLSGVNREAQQAANGGLASLNRELRGTLLGVSVGAALTAMGRSMVEAAMTTQTLEKSLAAVTGSNTAAAAEMAYVQATADRLGLTVGEAASAYISLTAATKGTTLEGQASKDIFEAVSLAMGKLGKSSADTQGALMAVEQMVSKGKVSAEELRGQLGERLPGAFKEAAKAMGYTTAELDDLLAKGDVAAEDLLPALARRLNDLYNDGKRVGGLTADWNILANAMTRLATAADTASGATSRIGQVLEWATGQANAFSEALNVISRWQEGKGFAYGDRDALASDFALRAKYLDEYIAKMKDFQAYVDANDLESIGAAARLEEGQALIARINEIDARIKTVRADVKAANEEAAAAAARAAASMNDGAVTLYQEHQAAIAKNAAELAKLSGKYDDSIAKQAEYARMEAVVTEAVKLGSMTKEEGRAKLEAFAAAQDKAAESAGRHARALSAEEQIVASVEQKYGLYKGQLDAVWKLESNRGKGAGTDSARWVKDLAAGGEHMTKIVGQFQMAEATAKGLGANMGSFAGQADAAAKYLAQAAAQGKTLWEQFATYHGGPNEKAWGEKTRAYADAAVKLVADATGTMQDLGQNTGQVITATLNQATNAVEGLVRRYLPARAATEDFEQAQRALAAAAGLVGLSAQEQAIILQGLKKDQDAAIQKSIESASALAEVWKNAVKRIDDTFANLWKDLFSGTKTTLESMKDAILSWLAEVAHALVTRPLVVAITASVSGAASGAMGGTGSGSGSFSLSSLGNLLGGNSIGSGLSSFFGGSTQSWAQGLMGTPNWAFGLGSIGGSLLGTALFGNATATQLGATFGSAAGSAMGAAYLAPVLGALGPLGAVLGGLLGGLAGGGLGSLFGGESKVGNYMAVYGQDKWAMGALEDSESGAYARGGFGLTFGLSDRGSNKIDAGEYQQAFAALAQVTQALETFFGEDLAATIEQSLTDLGGQPLGATVEAALAAVVSRIAAAAGQSGEDLGVAFDLALGDLSGTAQEMATQIEAAMAAATAYTAVAQEWDSAIGEMLGLTGDFRADVTALKGAVDAYGDSGETAAVTLARLVVQTQALSDAARLTATDLQGLSADGVLALGDALAEAFGGVANLQSRQSRYFQEFLSEAERDMMNFINAQDVLTRGTQGLLATLPASRDEFNTLIESLDLSTASGREMYATLLGLVDYFDVLYDYIEKTGEGVDGLTDKYAAQRLALLDLADQLAPRGGITSEELGTIDGALKAAGYSGDLWDMAGVGDFIRRLTDLDDAGGEAGQALLELLDLFDLLAQTAQERADLELRLLQMTGSEEAILTEIRRRELAATAEANRHLLQRIYFLEDEINKIDEEYSQRKAAIEEAYQAQVEAINAAYQAEVEAINAAYQAEVDGINAAYEARMAALSAEQDAARLQLQLAQAQLSAIQSAIDSLSDAALSATQISNASAMLAAWAASGVIPGQEPLDALLSALAADSAGNYATQIDWRAQQAKNLANLKTLADVAQNQVGTAEQTLAAIEAQGELMAAWRDEQLQQAQDWRDEQLKQAQDWRDEQIKALDAWREEQITLLREISINTYPDPSGQDRYAVAATDMSIVHVDELRLLRAEVAQLRADQAAIAASNAAVIRDVKDRLLKWDQDGLPSGRDDVTLLAAA